MRVVRLLSKTVCVGFISHLAGWDLCLKLVFFKRAETTVKHNVVGFSTYAAKRLVTSMGFSIYGLGFSHNV